MRMKRQNEIEYCDAIDYTAFDSTLDIGKKTTSKFLPFRAFSKYRRSSCFLPFDLKKR